MTKNAQEEMLKWIYAEHCQNNNFAVQTLVGNHQTQRASVSTFIHIYKGLKKTTIADHTVLELYEVLVISGFIFSIHFYRN